jgi:hypothetical protein
VNPSQQSHQYPQPLQFTSYSSELKHILKKLKSQFVPEPKHFIRLATLITQCKPAAYELYNYLMLGHWKHFKGWMANAEKGTNGQHAESRRALMFLIEKLIMVANSDYKRETTP